MGINNISIINSAYSALEAASAGMTVTSQNVAGASVEGFTRRQSASIVSTRALSSWSFGSTGFSVEGFTRFTDSLLDSQLRDQKSKSSYTSSLLQMVNGLDTSMMDPANSISDAISSFFNAAGTLASDTTRTSNIQNFAASATQVATRVSTFSDLIHQLGASTATNLTAILEQANSIAPALAKINLDVLMGSVPGNATPSADILDERDRLTMQLQDLLGGKTIINADGTATFQVGGMALVDGQSVNKFINTDVSTSPYGVQLQSGDGLQHSIGYLSSIGTTLTTNTGNLYEAPARTAFTGGQAGASFTILTDFIPKLKRELSALCLTLARDTNSVTQKNGGPITPVFAYKNTSSAGGVNTLTATILPDGTLVPKTIVGPSGYLTTYEDVIKGLSFVNLMDKSDPTSTNYDPSIAAVVNGVDWSADLFVSNITPATNTVLSIDSAAANAIEGNRASFSTPLSLITSSVASTIASWKAQDKANISVATRLNNSKQSISGVNLDEEAANLVKFQQLYGAASKVLQTANQMFATLLATMNA